MKIYTGTGDYGQTSLFSGERVAKAEFRLETYGDVDELSSVIGALIASIAAEHPGLIVELQRIQAELFTIAARLATSPGSDRDAKLKSIGAAEIKTLETAIDRMTALLPELKHFILPGGHVSAAWAHLARTVCRRVERKVVRLVKSNSAETTSNRFAGTLAYLNRLSDYFFIVARYCNWLAGVQENQWRSEATEQDSR